MSTEPDPTPSPDPLPSAMPPGLPLAPEQQMTVSQALTLIQIVTQRYTAMLMAAGALAPEEHRAVSDSFGVVAEAALAFERLSSQQAPAALAPNREQRRAAAKRAPGRVKS